MSRLRVPFRHIFILFMISIPLALGSLDVVAYIKVGLRPKEEKDDKLLIVELGSNFKMFHIDGMIKFQIYKVKNLNPVPLAV